MVAVENLLAPGSEELPDCKCGAELRLFAIKPRNEDTEIRIFKCDVCNHELQLAVWRVREIGLNSPADGVAKEVANKWGGSGSL